MEASDLEERVVNLPRHWLTMARAYAAYRRGARPAYAPFRIWVEPSSLCQLQCVMCPNRDLPPAMRGHMSMDVFRAVLDECKDFAYDLNLTHRGEPLLNPCIVDMVGLAAHSGPKVRLHTNGLLLSREMSRDLIGAGLHLISFSVDGFTRDAYERIRRGSSWERVVANVVGLLEEKLRAGSRRPYVIVQVIELEGSCATRDEREAFFKLFRGLPVDEFYVKKPSNWAGSYPTTLYPGPPVVPCTFPWYSLTVCWDGLIVPCPQDFFCRIPLGRVGGEGILGAWHGSPMVRLRGLMVRREFAQLDPCAGCDRVRRPRRAGLPATNLGVFLVENLLGYTRWKTRLFGRRGTVETQ